MISSGVTELVILVKGTARSAAAIHEPGHAIPPLPSPKRIAGRVRVHTPAPRFPPLVPGPKASARTGFLFAPAAVEASPPVRVRSDAAGTAPPARHRQSDGCGPNGRAIRPASAAHAASACKAAPVRDAQDLVFPRFAAHTFAPGRRR